MTSRRRPWPWSGPGEGPRVDGYRIVAELGSGGFSTVHAAEDLDAGRRVALKVARSNNRETRDRFAAEAAIGERLASARGIAGTLTHTSTRDGRPVLVMPFYDQGSAADLLPDGHRLSLASIIDIVRQVAQGLDSMHRQHFLHRDVSPRNILRSSELGFALGDLGCARAFNSTAQAPQTEALTPGYAAPEATSGTSVQTIASDVYGLAATAWALLTGEPPHGLPPDPAALDLLARYELRRSTQRPPIDRLLAAGVAFDVAELLVTSLDPDPARRPARVLDLSDALAAAVGTDPGAAGRTNTGWVGPADTGWDITRPDPSGSSTAPAQVVGPDTVGPIRPPISRRPDADLATELVGKPARTQPEAETNDSRDRPGRARRRWLRSGAVLGCFLIAYVLVRVFAGPDQRPGNAPSPAVGARSPTSSPAVTAPRDLVIEKHWDHNVSLSWTPVSNRDALSVLYLSVDGGKWKQLDTSIEAGRGRAVAQVPNPSQNNCFRLVVVVGAAPGVSSNPVCIQKLS
jgi:serine/threonine protein kinase